MLRDKGRSFGLKLSWGCALLFFVLFLGRAFSDEGIQNIYFWILSLMFMRTFGTPGLTMAWYQDFFQRNPLTHYSHVTGVNWFVQYPYMNPIGIEIGTSYSGDPTLDANANFWATDGLAASGLIGVVLVSIFCAFLFWVLDSVASKHELPFTALLISFTALNLANLSIFTTLLSGGLGFLIVILYLMPPAEALRKFRPA